MDGGSWTNIYGTTLRSGDEIDKTLYLVLRFLKATPFVVFVFFFLWSGLFCCVVVPGTLAFHVVHTLINCDCLVYFVSQSVTT